MSGNPENNVDQSRTNKFDLYQSVSRVESPSAEQRRRRFSWPQTQPQPAGHQHSGHAWRP